MDTRARITINALNIADELCDVLEQHWGSAHCSHDEDDPSRIRNRIVALRQEANDARKESERLGTMTMPHLSNCPHHGEGWCLECVQGLQAELESLRALVAHLPETGDENQEHRERIVPGRRYWLMVRTDDDSWRERFDCHGMLEQVGGHCRYSIIGETIESKCEVDDWPTDIYSRHPDTGEAAESEGAG